MEHHSWKLGDGDFGTLSYEKMQQKLDLTHPRLYVKEEGHRVAKPIALCHPIGSIEDGLTSNNNKVTAENKEEEEELDPDYPQGSLVFDQLGIGVSLYLKVLKSFMIFLLVCIVFSTPLYYFYSRGNVYKMQVGSTIESYLSIFSLGNIGDSNVRCN